MKFKSPLEIYKILPKTNCRHCDLATCMAFSAAVFKAQKRLADCPHLDKDTVGQFEEGPGAQSSVERSREDSLRALKEKISKIDLLSRAERMGAESSGENGKIKIKCLGKEFEVDAEGNLTSQCHTHVWFAIPLLNYLLYGAGKDPTGEWVPFRELKNGTSWNGLFEQRCEKPLKKIADDHPELFESLINIFSGTLADANTPYNLRANLKTDVSVMLFPFPKIPIMICYWRPEDGLESELHLFIDKTAEDNLTVEHIYSLGMGIASMMEKIMLKHT